MKYPTTGAVVGHVDLEDDPARSPGVQGADNLGLGLTGCAREEEVFRLGHDSVAPKWQMEHHPRRRHRRRCMERSNI